MLNDIRDPNIILDERVMIFMVMASGIFEKKSPDLIASLGRVQR
jgi:hypothetical protein